MDQWWSLREWGTDLTAIWTVNHYLFCKWWQFDTAFIYWIYYIRWTTCFPTIPTTRVPLERQTDWQTDRQEMWLSPQFRETCETSRLTNNDAKEPQCKLPDCFLLLNIFPTSILTYWTRWKENTKKGINLWKRLSKTFMLVSKKRRL